MTKYLDSIGLAYLWSKIKNYFATYTVIQNIGDSTSTSNITTISPNSAFRAVYTPNEGSQIYDVIVKMGGVDISETAAPSKYIQKSSAYVYIASVTGDLEINVVATKPIVFADSAVKALCVENWGGNYIEGEITEYEASLVTSLNSVFYGNTQITSFKELRYFTGIESFNITYSTHDYRGTGQFEGCTSLKSISFPSCSAWNYICVCKNCYALDEVEFGEYTGTFRALNFAYAFYYASRVANSSRYDLSLPTGNLHAVIIDRMCFGPNASSNYNGVKTVAPNGLFFNGSIWALGRQPAFDYARYMERIIGGLPGLDESATIIRGAKALTADALVEIFESLATVSGKTLTISSTANARLTDEQRAIATSKGWTLATSTVG